MLPDALYLSYWFQLHLSLGMLIHVPTCLYYSQIACPCFHIPCISFLCLSLAWRSVFIHAGLLSWLFHFLHTVTSHLQALRKLCLMISSLGLLLPAEQFHIWSCQARTWADQNLLFWSPCSHQSCATTHFSGWICVCTVHLHCSFANLVSVWVCACISVGIYIWMSRATCGTGCWIERCGFLTERVQNPFAAFQGMWFGGGKGGEWQPCNPSPELSHIIVLWSGIHKGTVFVVMGMLMIWWWYLPTWKVLATCLHDHLYQQLE